MNQTVNHVEMSKLYQLEELISKLELEAQKAMAFITLGLDKEESLKDAFLIVDEMENVFASFSDNDVRTIAHSKLIQAMKDLHFSAQQA